MADKEVEDHNAFSRWDSVGAIAMLASFPAVVTFVDDVTCVPPVAAVYQPPNV